MSSGTTVDATFCFVDIAGYTALTHTHGESAAADLVDEFDGLVRTALGSHGQLQSLVGDCALLVFAHPIAALDALAALYELVADREEFPVVRAGMHHGTALVRADRHFGSTVNLAARVAARATGGQILCTHPVARSVSAAGRADVEVDHRGAVLLRNLPAPVELYEIILSGCVREYAIDPVCKMQVDTRRAVGDLNFRNRRYWFCSLACVERFSGEPSAYV